jgi:putative hydrolase of the HAD superfamily
MASDKKITTLFLDIGGVLLSDGWGRNSRKAAAVQFHIDPDELEERHLINFETYELGKISLKTYLESVIFHKKRDFSISDFKKFMFNRSQAFPLMLNLVRQLKKKYGLKIAIVSNEGRELNAYRIKKFHLGNIADTFISSCFVHLRKPDIDIFQLALDLVQTKPEQILYLENQPIFIHNVAQMGIEGILHIDYESTLIKLKHFGLAP